MEVNKEIIIRKRDIYGALFENIVIVDIIKNFNAQNVRPTLSFFKDTNQNEIDLIIEVRGQTIPLEIKANETVNSKFFSTLTWFQKEPKNENAPIVVYGVNSSQTRTIGIVLAWNRLDVLYKK